MTKTPNFKSEDAGLQHVYNNANKLTVGSKFDFVGFEYTVIGFTKNSILTTSAEGNKKWGVLFFEDSITLGTLTLKK